MTTQQLPSPRLRASRLDYRRRLTPQRRSDLRRPGRRRQDEFEIFGRALPTVMSCCMIGGYDSDHADVLGVWHTDHILR